MATVPENDPAASAPLGVPPSAVPSDVVPAPAPAASGAPDPYADIGAPQTAQDAQPADPYADVGEAAPGTSEKIGVAAQSATKGIVDTGLPLSGMAAGAAIGTAIEPGLGTVVGAGVGGLAGYFASRGTDQLAGLKSPDEISPELRPYAKAGEATGSALPFGVAPVAAARAGVEIASPFLKKIFDYAAAEPLAFVRHEIAGAIGGGLGAFGAESVRPGDPVAATVATAAGGFFSPTRLATSAYKGVRSIALKAISLLSESGQQTLAAQRLASILHDFGEDPDVVAQLLKKPGVGVVQTSAQKPGVRVVQTSAQKTGDPALIALEQKLAKDSSRFGLQAQTTAENSLSAMRDLVTALRGTGDPAALTAAAQIRSQYFRTLITSRLQDAEGQAVAAAKGITTDDPQAVASLGVKAHALVSDALQDARQAESALWNEVPKDISAEPTNLVQEYERLKGDLIPGESLPNPPNFDMPAFFAKITGKQLGEGDNPKAAAEALFAPPAPTVPEAPQATYGDLVKFRRIVLGASRAARAAGQSRVAGAYDQLAQAALDDLDDSSAALSNPALDKARAFSRELNDTFTRTFANNALASSSTGADRIAPEVLLDRAFGTGGEMGDVRLRQLQDATDFMSKQGLWTPAAEARSKLMLDAQDRIIRLAASDAIDPATSRVNPAKLENFIRQNSLILDRFPEVRANLQDAIDTERGARDLASVYKGSQSTINSEAAFSKVANVESPVDAIKSAVSSKTPVNDLTALIKVAKRGSVDDPGGVQAVAGLRASAFDHAFAKATASDGTVDFGKLDQAFNQPLKPGQPSLLQVLQQNGVLAQGEVGRLNQILAAGQTVEKALKEGPSIAKNMEAANPLYNVVTRIVGSKLGGAASRAMGGGSTLIAQSAGSKYLREVLEKLNVNTMHTMLIRAAEDPRLMAMLLEHPTTAAMQWKQARYLHAYLISAGLMGAEPENGSNK